MIGFESYHGFLATKKENINFGNKVIIAWFLFEKFPFGILEHELLFQKSKPR
jgi:hypothetical protein